MKLLPPTIMLAAVLSITGCVVVKDVTTEQHRHTTLGQELIDLKKAYDDKIITAEEYEHLKQKIKKTAPHGLKKEISISELKAAAPDG